MGLINYLGESKVIKKICELLNVKDVKVNGSSVVDNTGDAIITVPVNTSDLNNDSGFIDNTVNNLANYYLKTETYTQAEVNALIGSVTTISFLVVQTLPTTGQSNIIYLVPKNPAQTNNIYDEYIYINNAWEKIGDTEIDLSNYYTKTQTDNIIAGLDGSVTGTPSASKTLTSFSETDGVVSATFGDISITKSQMTDYCKNLSTEDLNDIRTSGFYIGQNNNTCTNKPTRINQFGLIVSRSATSSTTYCTQLLFAPSSGIIHERHDIQGTWSSWVEVKTTDTTYSFATGTNFGSLSIDGTDIPVQMRATTVTTAGTDLNNYTSAGVYYFSSANAPLNSPLANSYGVLIVIVYTDTARKQIWLRHATGEPMSDYTYIRTYRSSAWGTWQKYALAETEDVENVKQLAVGTSSSQYRVLLTTTDTNTEETNTVRKCSSLLFQASTGDLTFSRPHTGTGATAQRFIIGNDTPIATSGNNYSVLRMYGKGQYYGQFVDSQNGLNANRTYTLPDQNGCMAIRDNITRAKLDNNWNLLSLPYYSTGGTTHGTTYVVNGDGSLSFTNNVTETTSIVLRRYSEGWKLPAGKYRLTGCPSGGGSSKYGIRIGTTAGTSSITWLGYDYGSGFEITLTEEKQIVIQINLYTGYGNELTFTPTLVRLDGGWVDLGTQNNIPDIFSEYKFVFTFTDTDDSSIPITNAVIDIPRALLVSGQTYSAIAGSMGDPNSNIYVATIKNIINGNYIDFGYMVSVSLLRGNHGFTPTLTLYGKI